MGDVDEVDEESPLVSQEHISAVGGPANEINGSNVSLSGERDSVPLPMLLPHDGGVANYHKRVFHMISIFISS